MLVLDIFSASVSCSLSQHGVQGELCSAHSVTATLTGLKGSSHSHSFKDVGHSICVHLSGSCVTASFCFSSLSSVSFSLSLSLSL